MTHNVYFVTDESIYSWNKEKKHRNKCITMIKAKKHVDQSASLALVLITDKTDKIISGSIACYFPKDGKHKGYNGVQIIADIYKGKAPKDSGLLRYLDVTGRRLHEIGFKNGYMSTYGVIKSKTPDSTKSVNAVICIDWTLTTYIYDSNHYLVDVIVEDLGTTCEDCVSGDFGSLCGDSGGGGGGTGGGGSAVAVPAAPKSIAPAIAPVPIAQIAARRAGRAEDNMAGSFKR